MVEHGEESVDYGGAIGNGERGVLLGQFWLFGQPADLTDSFTCWMPKMRRRRPSGAVLVDRQTHREMAGIKAAVNVPMLYNFVVLF